MPQSLYIHVSTNCSLKTVSLSNTILSLSALVLYNAEPIPPLYVWAPLGDVVVDVVGLSLFSRLLSGRVTDLDDPFEIVLVLDWFVVASTAST